MSILSLVYAPSKVLEEKSAEVKNIDNQVKKLVSNMFDTMYENNGVGLAAPQVNESLQILVIDCSNKDNEFEPRVLINPVIVNQSKIYFSVSRPESLLVDFIDLDGNKKEKLFSGFEAVCVQHEIDHLSGTLFTAYLSRLKRQIIVKKMQKFKKNLNKSI